MINIQRLHNMELQYSLVLVVMIINSIMNKKFIDKVTIMDIIKYN